MDSTLPPTLCLLFEPFRCLFTAPSFQNFVVLISGWILCIGRHTVTRVLQFSGHATHGKHHSAYYRFLNRAVWSLDEVSHILLNLVLPWLPEAMIFALVDDTLCRKSGPHLWGGGMHYDPLLSSYGKGRQRRTVLSFGHDWVILSLWVPLPWNPDRGIALPVLFRLYRSPKRCPAEEYRKRTDLARELIQLLRSWLPPGRLLAVVGDDEYSCRTILKPLLTRVTFVGTMSMKAALFDLPGPYRGRGCPRKKGPRLPSPQQLANDHRVPWESYTCHIYGRQVTLWVKSRVVLWYHVAGSHPVRLIVTRDPQGWVEDRAYFVTDPTWPIPSIVQGVARRWPAEVMHRQVKQELGLEDPQNGWWRRPSAQARPVKQAGPQPHACRGKQAVQRTVPLAFLSYTLVALWYFQHGEVAADVQRVRQQAPWYRHKREPCFGDMLKAVRRTIWHQRFFAQPTLQPVSAKIVELFPEWFLVA